MPPTGSFGGCFEFSPSNAVFLSLSLEIYKLPSCSQTGSTAVVWSVPMSYIGPVGGVGATHGDVRGLFLVLTLYRHVFKPKSRNMQIIVVFSNRESRGCGVSSYELHWSRGRCWCHPRGRSGAVSSFHPLTPCF